MDYANLRRVPMWMAERTLNFLRKRDAAEFVEVDWSNNQLSFQLHVPIPGDGLTCMIPQAFDGKAITAVSRNDKKQSYTLQSVKDSDYALVTTVPGDNRFVVTYAERKEESKP